MSSSSELTHPRSKYTHQVHKHVTLHHLAALDNVHPIGMRDDAHSIGTPRYRLRHDKRKRRPQYSDDNGAARADSAWQPHVPPSVYGSGVESPSMRCSPLATTSPMPGLAPPTLASNEPMMGANKERHRIENKRKWQALQQAQEPCSYWAWHKGDFALPTPKQILKEYRGSMCSLGLTLHHPAAELLLQYATERCPTNTERPWIFFSEMEAAVMRGPHVSPLQPNAMEQLVLEVDAK
mmetsp:Transcript_30936/g.56076  ORF Transcript_30936/g.56076 Transcript_30936/m.56076 type:complete len:237 (+) Transcript_30936:2264-2974(+)